MLLFAVILLMVLPSRTRRTRLRRTGRRPTRTRRNVMKRAVHGSEYRPRSDPPTICQQPYNNIVVTSVLDIPEPIAPNPAVVLVTISELGTALWKQLGASQNPGLTFKILRCAAWLTSGSYFNVSFNDLQRSTIDSPPIEMTLEDSAAKNHFAKVGFVWSAADSSVPYDSSNEPSAGRTIITIKTPTAGTCLLHFQLQWRVKTASAPDSVPGHLQPLSMATRSLHQDDTNSSLRELCSLLRHKLVIGVSDDSSSPD